MSRRSRNGAQQHANNTFKHVSQVCLLLLRSCPATLTLPRSVSTTVWRLPHAICVTLAPSSLRCFTMQGFGCPLSLPCPSCRCSAAGEERDMDEFKKSVGE